MKQLNDILLPDSGDAENLPSGMSSLRRYAHMLEFIKKDGGTKTDPWVGDVQSGRESRPSLGVVPCLTRSRCGTGGHWLFHKNRMLHLREIEILQGIPANRVKWAGLCSERNYKQMIGNAFTVSVATRVCLALLRTIAASKTLPDLADPWGS